MKKYSLTELAMSDLEGIYDFTAQESSIAADRLTDSLFLAMENLATMPGMGHKRPDLTDLDVRFWQVFRFLIVYQENKAGIGIVRVLGSNMDVAAVLSP